MTYTAIRLYYLVILIATTRCQECDEKDIVTELRVIEGSSLPTPIAISAHTFTDVIRKGNLFVDKSLWLNQVYREMYDDTCPVFIIARPSGMGKSVMMDMLRLFSEAPIDNKTDLILPRNQSVGYRIFEHGEIPVGNGQIRKLNRPLLISELRDVMETHQGQYIVIFANFSGLKPRSFEEAKRGMGYRFYEALRKFNFDRIDEVIDSGSSDSTIQDLVDSLKSGDYEWRALAKIWMALKEFYKRDVVIIMDAYDEPMVEILLEPTSNITEVALQVIEWYEDLFTIIDTYNSTFKRVIMSGTLKLGFEDLYSNYGLYNEMMGEILYHPFGFKQNEVDAICDHVGIPKSLSSKAIYHYGGFHMSSNEESSFHPVSIAKFVVKRKLEHFWTPKSSFEQFFDIFMEVPEFREFLHNVTLDLCGVKGPYTVHDLIITCMNKGFIQQFSEFLQNPDIIKADHYLRDDILLAAKCICRSCGYLSRLNEVPNEEVEMNIRAKLMAYGP